MPTDRPTHWILPKTSAPVSGYRVRLQSAGARQAAGPQCRVAGIFLLIIACYGAWFLSCGNEANEQAPPVVVRFRQRRRSAPPPRRLFLHRCFKTPSRPLIASYGNILESLPAAGRTHPDAQPRRPGLRPL